MPQQKATTTAADGGGKTVAPMPFMQNACFLCGKEIGESEPRQFYSTSGSTQLMLGHTGCINKFKANGEKWPEEEKPEPRVSDLGDVRQVSVGTARLGFTPYRLTVSCEGKIAELGLKAVIPDLIAALKAIEQSL